MGDGKRNWIMFRDEWSRGWSRSKDREREERIVGDEGARWTNSGQSDEAERC
jgi:hypothetical protein